MFVDDRIDGAVGDFGDFRVGFTFKDLARDVDIHHPETLRDRARRMGGSLVAEEFLEHP